MKKKVRSKSVTLSQNEINERLIQEDNKLQSEAESVVRDGMGIDYYSDIPYIFNELVNSIKNKLKEIKNE